MMKQCRFCGKELHKQASFCPYCMQNQIEKQIESIQNTKSRKLIFVFVVGIVLFLTATIFFITIDKKETNANHSEHETTPQITTLNTETTITTMGTIVTTAPTEATTLTNSTTTKITTTEFVSVLTEENATVLSEVYIVGDYMTDGKTLSQIQGYGGYENLGGIILTIDEITENSITFSIVQYSESGLATETISVRNITASIVDNTANFEFRDMLDGMGTGTLTFENGKIHIQTYGNESMGNPTSIVVDEWLKS